MSVFYWSSPSGQTSTSLPVLYSSRWYSNPVLFPPPGIFSDFCGTTPTSALCTKGVIIIWFCVLAHSSMATWKTSPWDFRSSLGQLMSGSLSPTPSTRCTESQAKPSLPPATRRSWATPKSWRSLSSQKTTWGQRKGWGPRVVGLYGEASGRELGQETLMLAEGTMDGGSHSLMDPSRFVEKVSIFRVLYLSPCHGCQEEEYQRICGLCYLGWGLMYVHFNIYLA